MTPLMGCIDGGELSWVFLGNSTLRFSRRLQCHCVASPRGHMTQPESSLPACSSLPVGTCRCNSCHRRRQGAYGRRLFSLDEADRTSIGTRALQASFAERLHCFEMGNAVWTSHCILHAANAVFLSRRGCTCDKWTCPRLNRDASIALLRDAGMQQPKSLRSQDNRLGQTVFQSACS